MSAKVVLIFLFSAMLGASVVLWRRSPLPEAVGWARRAETVARASQERVTVSLLFGTEKQDWLSAVTRDFQSAHPEIELQMTGKGSLESVQAIMDGVVQPTLFSPADSLALRLLESDWQSKNGRSLFATGSDAPRPLLLSPLVFLIWEDRARVLREAGKGRLSWRLLHDAVVSNRGWVAIGGKAEWGSIKLGHTDPTRSNSGLQTLLSMTFEYFPRASKLQVGDLLDPDFQAFITNIERGVSTFEASTGTFITDMVRFGPSKYDIALAYESLAIARVANAEGRWGKLRVEYPNPTLWSDHPIALLDADWVRPEQKAAARTLIAYLTSVPVQGRALDYGFRPAEITVPLKSADAQNPFTRLAAHGLRIDVPPAADPPSGAVTRALLALWARLTSRP